MLSVCMVTEDSELASGMATRFHPFVTARAKTFPEALGVLKHWLQPVDRYGFLAKRLAESELAGCFPGEVLDFLDVTIGDDISWFIDEVATCLNSIASTAPELRGDSRYQRLKQQLALRGRV